MFPNSKFKTGISTVAFFLFGVLIAFFFEDRYRQLVRYSFKLFNGEKIQFIGKNFHLFASYRFVIALGLFTSCTFLSLQYSFKAIRVKNAVLAILIFFASTFIICLLDSKRLLFECTACDDGIKRLSFHEITYDMYFIISLTTSIVFLISNHFLKEKKQRRTNNLIDK